MSLFRKAYSLKIKIFSLIIISKDFYKLLDFWDPKVKYLLIDWYSSPFYPVNSFENDGWIFDSSLEDNKEIDKLSLSAYAVFKFLVNSNFIYTLEEIKVIWTSAKDSFENDFNFLLEEFRKLSPEPINLKVNVCHNLPNLYIYDFKEDLKYYEYSIRNVLLYGQIYEKVIFSKANDEKNESKADEFIFQLLSEEKEYSNKIHSLFGELLSKFGTRYNYNLNSLINEWFHFVEFYLYEDQPYDANFVVYMTKLDGIDSNIYMNQRKVINEEYHYLNEELKIDEFNLSLAKDTQIKRITFANNSDLNALNGKETFKISVNYNTLTIYCKNIDDKLVIIFLRFIF